MDDFIDALNRKFRELPLDKQERIRKMLNAHTTEPVFENDGAERDWSHLNCPMCGGSGHIDDVTHNAGGKRSDD